MIDYIKANNLENTNLVKTIFTKRNSGDFFYNEEKSHKDFIGLSQIFNINIDNIIRIYQCHDNKIMIANKEDGGIGVLREEKIKKYDGIITDQKNLLITTIEADCVPILMLDPKKKVIANIHSGWRGTSKMISIEAIKTMKDKFDVDPKDILIYMGPSICSKCYEVSEDLIKDFSINYDKNEIDTIFKIKNNNKYLLDLKLAIKIKLLKYGIKEENIEISNICTYEDTDFDSKRRDDKEGKGTNGRMLSGIMLI